MNTLANTRLVKTKSALWLLVGIAVVTAASRFLRGLGPTTALTDRTPWGLWIGFDVLAGVALAAGGFVIAATVHIFHLKRYEPLVRPAILTACLGYVAVVLGLLADLGRPWNIWRMTVDWQPTSPLFEVGWCVMLYLTVLVLEFAPVAFEGLHWPRALRLVRRVTLLLVIAGIGLSTLHQSSLGTLFLLVGRRMHPLWYSPILPLLFLVSAIGLGLCTVTVESLVSSWLYRREPEWPLLRGLIPATSIVIGLYLMLRVGDLAVRGSLGLALQPSWTSALFATELGLSAVLPLVLFAIAWFRNRPRLQGIGALSVVLGVVLHRIAVGGLAHVTVTGDPYIPSLTELSISLGVVATMALVFLFLAEHLPVWHQQPTTDTHFQPALPDLSSGTLFGGPWFSRSHLAGLSFVTGVVLGVVLVETTTAQGDRPRREPVQQARSVDVERTPDPDGLGERLRLISAEAVSDPDRLVATALLIDGNRQGRAVLFNHRAHQDRNGGTLSCGMCHHFNLHLDQGTPCASCHRDMYRTSDVFDHGRHIAAAGGNASCQRCHPAGQPKSRSSATSCQSADCHASDVRAEAVILRREPTAPGMAVGYRAAMHGLCIECHRRHEAQQRVAEPYLSRCTWCHPPTEPGAAPLSEDGRLALHLKDQ